jgi:3'-5' exoribonuclease
MKPAFVNTLEPSQTVISSFLVQSKEVREKKSGEPYLSLLLGDKTGRVDAKMWDNVSEVLEAFDRDDFIKVKGIVQLHMNRPQITIHKLRRMDDAEVDFADYFPCSDRDSEDMWSELRGVVDAIRDDHIRALLNAFLNDPEIAPRFKKSPAAKSIHHAYLGGLLEHVLSLCNLSRAVAPNYPGIDLDLLIAGAILHDIGKIFELTYDRGFSYTAEGQLLGHILIAFRMIGDKVREIAGFPDRLRTLIEHIVLSHHGQLDFGSPKVPQFAEALLFHYLDDLDSKMECIRMTVRNDRQSSEFFTSYSSSLERSVLKKDVYLESPTARVPAAEAVPQQWVPVSDSHQSPVPAPPFQPDLLPPPVVSPAAPRAARAAAPDRAPNSVFGSKLLDALRTDKE